MSPEAKRKTVPITIAKASRGRFSDLGEVSDINLISRRGDAKGGRIQSDWIPRIIDRTNGLLSYRFECIARFPLTLSDS